MADKKPVKATYSGTDTNGLAEFVAADTIGVVDGGTGLATVATDNILTGNGTSALSAEANLTFDGTLLAAADGSQLVVGNTAVVTTDRTAGAQILGSSNDDAALLIGRFDDSTVGGKLAFVKSRNATIGGNTIVQSGDQIGGFVFNVSDGGDLVSNAAQILAKVDGTPGANDTPGRLEFWTTPDGSNTSTERMRILSSGGITFNGDTATANALDDYEEGTWTPVIKYGGSGGTAYSLGATVATYTKIGRVVYFSCEVAVTNPSASNDTSDINVSGLPYTAANIAQWWRVCNNWTNYTNSVGVPMGAVHQNSTVIVQYQQQNNGGWGGDLDSSEIYVASGSNYFAASGFYHTA